MNTYYRMKATLKRIRWRMRRASVSKRYRLDDLRDSPVLFGTAIPKSGSHLIIQILRGFAKLGPFVISGFPPVNRGEDNMKLDNEAVVENLKRMLSGDIGYGYLHDK